MRFLAYRMGKHFQGLAQAARSARKAGRISERASRKYISIDEAYNRVRHITSACAQHMRLQIVSDLGIDRAPTPTFGSSCSDFSFGDDMENSPESRGDDVHAGVGSVVYDLTKDAHYITFGQDLDFACLSRSDCGNNGDLYMSLSCKMEFSGVADAGPKHHGPKPQDIGRLCTLLWDLSSTAAPF